MTGRITDVDRGLAAVAQRVAERGRVRVGLLADKGQEPKTQRGPTGAIVPTEMTLVDIAAIHEFGAPAAGIPKRSFLRDTVDGGADEIRRTQSVVARQIVLGGLRVRTGLDRIGAKVSGMIQRRIARRIPPPNAEATVERKGSDVPLIDTGQLRSSITWALEELR